MGLFSKLRRSIRKVTARIETNVGRALTQVAPIVAALAPGPIGAIARLAVAQQQAAEPLPFVPGATGAPLGLAGFAAQQRRTTLGPQFRAAQQVVPASLPQRSQFPFLQQEAAGFGGFSAPFGQANFTSGASGSRGAARSPCAFGGQTNIFPQQSFLGAPLHQPQPFAGFFPQAQTFAPAPRQQFFQPQLAQPAFGGFAGFRSFF